jgi:hypothetical protein
MSSEKIEELLSTDHPLVERFQFVQVYESPAEVAFRLDIVHKVGVEFMQQRDASGRKIKQTKRVTSPDDRIGCGNRLLYLSGEKLFAENQTFFPNQEFNDIGIGSALYEAQERLYRALGVEKISLLAVDVGRYVWAKQGFNCDSRAQLSRTAEEFAAFLEGEGLEALSEIKYLWDIACFDIKGVRFNDYPLGKYWMLRAADSWSGFRFLDDELSNKVAETSRAATRGKRKRKIFPYH